MKAGGIKIMALKTLYLSFIASILEYKADLNTKCKCVCIAMCSLVMSQFSCDFL